MPRVQAVWTDHPRTLEIWVFNFFLANSGARHVRNTLNISLVLRHESVFVDNPCRCCHRLLSLLSSFVVVIRRPCALPLFVVVLHHSPSSSSSFVVVIRHPRALSSIYAIFCSRLSFNVVVIHCRHSFSLFFRHPLPSCAVTIRRCHSSCPPFVVNTRNVVRRSKLLSRLLVAICRHSGDCRNLR